MKASKVISILTCHIYFFFTQYCIVSTENTGNLKGLLSVHGGSLSYKGICHISKLICYSKRGEPRLSFGYKFVGLPWKLLKLYPTVHSYLFFSSHSIVLFPLRTPTTWRSATCTRRLFKVWRNWPYSKLIGYSQRGETRLSVGYKFIGLPWKLLKLYPSLQSYFFFFSSHCIVLFPLKTQATWKIAKCTRRLFKL